MVKGSLLLQGGCLVCHCHFLLTSINHADRAAKNTSACWDPADVSTRLLLVGCVGEAGLFTLQSVCAVTYWELSLRALTCSRDSICRPLCLPCPPSHLTLMAASKVQCTFQLQLSISLLSVCVETLVLWGDITEPGSPTSGLRSADLC